MHLPGWTLLEALTHHDPGGRGLPAYRVAGAPLDAGNLRRAAEDLAARAVAVAIVTGFCVETDTGVTAETDGPPGALFLARALRHCGVEVALVGDRYVTPLLTAGCRRWGLPAECLHEMPLELPTAKAAAWTQGFLDGPFGRQLTHLLAIERCGPSHTLASMTAQRRAGPPPVEEFERTVPPGDRDVYHNMRGLPLDAHTAKTHLLLEQAASRQPRITTIGIGDGGNELGMGSFPWETVARAVGTSPAPRIVCRIAADLPLLAGVSNWAGYALGLAVCQLRLGSVPPTWTAEVLRLLLETLVQAGAVDGVTRRPEATVDGLPLEEYLRHFAAIRAAVVG